MLIYKRYKIFGFILMVAFSNADNMVMRYIDCDSPTQRTHHIPKIDRLASGNAMTILPVNNWARRLARVFFSGPRLKRILKHI